MKYLIVVPFTILAACRQTPPAYIHLEGKAQGTTFHITYFDSLSRDFSLPVDSLFRLIDRSMSLWDSTSIISRFNRNEQGTIADEHFTAVFRRAQEVSEATDGVFDITVGPLVKAWGFSYKKGLPPPDSAQVDSLLQLCGFHKIRLENGILIKADPRMEVDMNAIAQGYTVDVMAHFLEQNGVRNYMVEIGGEVRTAGRNDKGEPWQIGIDKPSETETAGRPLQTVAPLSGKSLATSGSYRKFVVRDGKKFSHAIDPRTGYPITHQLLSVSVIANDCATADAFATAFLVMGMEKAMETAAKLDLKIYGIYTDEKGETQVRTNFGDLTE
ncbi:MAG: FAD:protein FMN transferase [Thermoanaerobaculia bacterium]|nr:FAD:protein FMN transferase [Thermoanaerobaculia bacterium]